MGQTLDGVSATASQHGAKQVSLPLQADGNYYATSVRRNQIVAPASAYAPIIGQRTAYTQRLKYSDDWSQANWTKAASTATANAATDPEGGSTACKLAEDNTNAAHNASQAMTVASGALAFGVLAKAGERSYLRLRINNGTDGNLAIAVFNLSTGAVLSGSGSIKALLNGWYWCSVTGTATVSNSTAFADLTSDGTTFSYTGTTGSGVYVWRATCYLAAAIGPAVATTSATRAVTSAPVDPDDPLAFLVMEEEPQQSALDLGVALWGREYANVPAQTVTYSTLSVTKPKPTATALNMMLVTGAGTSSLTGVGGYEYQGYLWDMIYNRIYGPSTGVSGVVSGGNYRVTWTGHGLAGTERIAVYATIPGTTAWYLFSSSQYSVIDANTIDLLGWSVMSAATYAGKFYRDYTPGLDRIGCKVTDTYYLPGMTLGIATASDIPIPSPLLNDAAFMAAVLATLIGYVDYDATELQIWKGPIYKLRTIQINMADV